MSFSYNTKATNWLEESGISIKYARRAGWKQQQNGWIQLPYFDLNGKATGFLRYKVFDRGDQKYHQDAKGKHFYFPPWPSDPKKWADIAKNPKRRLIIVEGEKKAACGVINGLACIGIQGVSSWHADELAHITWKGRLVWLTPDSDALNPRKGEIRSQTLKLADHLTSLGAVVFVCVLPPLAGQSKTGLDDFLVAKGKEALEDTAHALDSEIIKAWRSDTDAGLPPLSFEPVAAEWLNKKPPVTEFTWMAYLPRGVVALLVGPGGVGKTYLLLSICMAIACGARLFGLPTRKGKVVYLALEDPPEVLRHRVYQLAKAHKFDTKALEQNLVVASLVGEQLHLVGLKGGVTTQSAAVPELIERLKQESPELLVLDPFARLHGADENANSTGTALVNANERIAREVGCTVLLSHHTGKVNASRQRDDAYAARGASGIADAARVVLTLYVVEPDEALKRFVITPEEAARGVLKLTHAKNNYGPKFKDVHLRRMEHGVLEQFEPEFKKDTDYESWLVKLRAYGKPLTRRAVTRDETDRGGHRTEIFGKGCARPMAEKFWQQAVTAGHIKPTGKRAKGGGDLYEVSGAQPNENG